jgi:hypothetical protein
MVGRTAAQGRIPALKRTVFTSHGENPRRIGRIRREPALSGAFRAERTPHFARSFLPSPECRQNVETGWRSGVNANYQATSRATSKPSNASGGDQAVAASGKGRATGRLSYSRSARKRVFQLAVRGSPACSSSCLRCSRCFGCRCRAERTWNSRSSLTVLQLADVRRRRPGPSHLDRSAPV